MKAFFKALAHAAIGGTAAGVASAWTGSQSFKQIGLVAAASAITSVLSLFAKKPTEQPTE